MTTTNGSADLGKVVHEMRAQRRLYIKPQAVRIGIDRTETGWPDNYEDGNEGIGGEVFHGPNS